MNPKTSDQGPLKKIPSGVFGFNPLMDGGINQFSTTVVIGASGAGKTTFAWQFLRRGIEQGQDAIFITLDETPEQIIKETKQMGWTNIENVIDNGEMVFVDAGGKQFSDFIRNELSDFVRSWEGHDARIVIDPLTPVMWSVKEKYQQRELISYLLRQTRKIGTVLCTLEEHGTAGDLSSPEIAIPMYLGDNVIHLRYNSQESPETRNLKIIKCRSSKHSKFAHPYTIIRGAGIIIHPLENRRGEKETFHELQEKLKKRISNVEKKKIKNVPGRVLKDLVSTVREMEGEEMIEGMNVDQVLDLLLQEYGLE